MSLGSNWSLHPRSHMFYIELCLMFVQIESKIYIKIAWETQQRYLVILCHFKHEASTTRDHIKKNSFRRTLRFGLSKKHVRKILSLPSRLPPPFYPTINDNIWAESGGVSIETTLVTLVTFHSFSFADIQHGHCKPSIEWFWKLRLWSPRTWSRR